MNKLFSKPKLIPNILSKIWPIIWLIFIASEYILYREFTYVNYNSVVLFSVLTVCFLILVFFYRKQFVTRNLTFYNCILAFLISFYFSYNTVRVYNFKDFLPNSTRLLFFVCNFYVFYFIAIFVLSVLYKYCFLHNEDKKEISRSKKRLIEGFIFVFVFIFILFFYIPAETFFSSFQDFCYPYWLLVKASMVDAVFYTLMFTLIIGVLNDKFYGITRAVGTGLLIAIYVQYMFMNGSIGFFDGSVYDISKHVLETIINTLVWLVLIIVPLVISLKNNKILLKPSMYITYILGMLHIVSYILLLITADKQCFKYASTYYDFSEQFVVGNNKNIVVLIIDAADNDVLVNDIIKNNNPIMDNFSDFNIYTNTSSVYDYTNHSQLQMITNFPFDNTCVSQKRREIAWNTPWAKEFYKRFHEAGYRINFYNLENETSEYVIGNVDNARLVENENIGIQYINYKVIRGRSSEITRFRVLPNILKMKVSFKNMFKGNEQIIVYNIDKGSYDNEDFADNCSLSLGDNDNYLIFNHTRGVHLPNDKIENYEYCLNYANKYIDEMKRLGTYDDATIIITSDHGHIEETTTELEPATPIFMIKHANESHNKYVLNDAPISHSDIMATLLYNAGLYNGDMNSNVEVTSATVTQGLNSIDELIPGATKDTFSKDSKEVTVNLADEQLFGYPVEYYSEDCDRTRTWYDRYYDPNYLHVGGYTVYCGFTFTGDRKELEEKVENREMTEYQLPVKYE